MSRGLGAPTPSPHADTDCRQGLLSSRAPASSTARRSQWTRTMHSDALRERRCAHCQRLFAICRACDRGHRYCSDFCRLHGKRAVRRRIARAYRSSPEARADHRDRQRARRAVARSVPHTGSAPKLVTTTIEPPTTAPAATIVVAPPQPSATELDAHLSLSRCVRCGRQSLWIQRPVARPRSHSRSRSPPDFASR